MVEAATESKCIKLILDSKLTTILLFSDPPKEPVVAPGGLESAFDEFGVADVSLNSNRWDCKDHWDKSWAQKGISILLTKNSQLTLDLLF